MKNRDGSSTESCIQALTDAIRDQRARGAFDTILIAALGEIAIRTALADKETAQIHLDALAAITTAAADAHRGKTVINMAKAIFETPSHKG